MTRNLKKKSNYVNFCSKQSANGLRNLNGNEKQEKYSPFKWKSYFYHPNWQI